MKNDAPYGYYNYKTYFIIIAIIERDLEMSRNHNIEYRKAQWRQMLGIESQIQRQVESTFKEGQDPQGVFTTIMMMMITFNNNVICR